MSKFKLISYLFVVLGLLVVIGASYVIFQYTTGMINAIVDFVTTNDYSKLQSCGVTPPGEFAKLKNDFATLILPALYLGLPGLLLVVSALMFLAGFYFHKGKLEDDARKHEELERAMVHKIVKKMESEKSAPRAGGHSRMAKGQDEEPPPGEEEPEAEPESVEYAAEEEPEEELPPPRPPARKRR